MSERERRNEDAARETQRTDPPSNEARERADSLRGNARNLIAAAHRIVDDTLSSNSEDFLKATRQQGGQ
jgi:hypothetical protein